MIVTLVVVAFVVLVLSAATAAQRAVRRTPGRHAAGDGSSASWYGDGSSYDGGYHGHGHSDGGGWGGDGGGGDGGGGGGGGD